MPRLNRKLPRLRIRTILLVINLIVILAPLSGIYFFKLYENELVRQTESELIVQGAFISALFRQEMTEDEKETLGRPIPPLPVMDETYKPVLPQLDLSTDWLLPKRPNALPASSPPEAGALAIAKRLEPVVEEAGLTTLAGFSVMDSAGTVLMGSEKNLSLAHLPEVQKAMEGQYASTMRTRLSDSPPAALASISRSTIFRVFAAYPIVENNRLYGVVLLSRSPRNVLKALYEERVGIAEAGGMVLVAVLLISLLTSRAISRPIKALLSQVREMAEGKGTITPISSPVTREVAELSTQMAWMAEKLHARSDYIRQFALHLSHEFKTPLTAIQGALELMKEHGKEMPKEQRDRFLDNTLADTERLKLLVSRMLELARADAVEPRQEHCDAAILLQTLSQRYWQKGLTLHFPPDAGTIPLPHDIAETVFVNLFDNSLQHSATEVTLSLSLTETETVMTIADNGNGISPTTASQVFTPFFTTRRSDGGTGLGLPIVKSLLNAYGVVISLVSGTPHAVFHILYKR